MKINKVAEKSLYLHQQIASGEVGDNKDKFEVDVAVPTYGTWIITFPDPNKKDGEISRYRYKLSVSEFVQEAYGIYLDDLKVKDGKK